MNLRVAVLDTDMLGHTLVAATYDKRVVIMDEREEVKKMTFYRSHSKPVLGVKEPVTIKYHQLIIFIFLLVILLLDVVLCQIVIVVDQVTPRHIMSLSEDQTLVVYDRLN